MDSMDKPFLLVMKAIPTTGGSHMQIYMLSIRPMGYIITIMQIDIFIYFSVSIAHDSTDKFEGCMCGHLWDIGKS